jgi:mannosyl-3-phosphoglycerate phosphatase
MTAEEVSTLCQLPLEQAVLARQREYDEPFLILDPDRTGALVAAIEEQGRQWTKGGRFWHILGANDKALAVKALAGLFEKAYGPVVTVGLGDGLNDVPFLNVVTAPVLIRSSHSAELKSRVPHGQLTDRPGPAGWNDALLSMIPG